MSTVEVICPSCESWREEDVSEEEITAATMDGNPIISRCPKCQEAADIVFDMQHPHIGCCQGVK